MIGTKFGRLTVQSSASIGPTTVRSYRCLCDCGNVVVVLKSALKIGKTRSCGCLVKDTIAGIGHRNATHGEARHNNRTSREYRAWTSIKSRCYNSNNKKFHLYGGRGISMCREWSGSIEAFLRDVGRCPSPNHSLDRFPNKNGNYEPGNVRWATITEQNRNKRNNVHFEYSGNTLTLPEWAERTGIGLHVLKGRLKLGWPIEKVLTAPVEKRAARSFRARSAAA